MLWIVAVTTHLSHFPPNFIQSLFFLVFANSHPHSVPLLSQFPPLFNLEANSLYQLKVDLPYKWYFHLQSPTGSLFYVLHISPIFLLSCNILSPFFKKIHILQKVSQLLMQLCPKTEKGANFLLQCWNFDYGCSFEFWARALFFNS